MGETIGIFELIKLIKNKWYIVVLMSVVGFILAFVFSAYIINPQYESSISLLVSRSQTAEEPLQQGEINTNIQMIRTYRDMIENPIVLGKVNEKLPEKISTESLYEKIEVQTQDDSQIFSIKVTDTDPERASLIANSVAEIFRENIDRIINVKDMVILSPAVPNYQSVSPDVKFNLIVGTIAGAILGIASILIYAMTDTKIYDESFISEELNWNRLGTISTLKKEDYIPLEEPIVEKRVKEKLVSTDHVQSNIKG